MSRTRRKFTRYLLITIALLGFCSITALITDPPNPESDLTTTSLFLLNSEAMASQHYLTDSSDGLMTDSLGRHQAGTAVMAAENNNDDRAPASISREALLEIHCDDDDQSFTTGNTRFRLRGRACIVPGSAKLITQVLNETNGYVATVFHRTPETFTTDYINLNQGENHIAVTFDTDQGSTQKNITVYRN